VEAFFLLDSYARSVAINMSLIVQIALNLVLVFFHPRFFHYCPDRLQPGQHRVLAWIVYVFPVDFSSAGGRFNLVFRIVLIIGIVGSAIAASQLRALPGAFSAEPRREDLDERDGGE